MNIRVTSVGNDSEDGYLIEFIRVSEKPYCRQLSVVVKVPSEGTSLEEALNLGAMAARTMFAKMDEFNQNEDRK